jgi:diacylglycerol kinase family enzyme
LLHGKDVVIEHADGIIRERLIARDGEKEKMAPPYRFRVRENALRVLVPKEA